jgi:glycosyltransferase involved in cell wall biosynthesis
MKLPITAVIPVKNEENEIKELASNLSFCDEVLIVDNFSTDNTVSIARSKNFRVIKSDQNSFSKLRQFGDDNATHDWVLSMDADMRVTPELKQELSGIMKSQLADGYKIGRRNIIFGKEMKYTDWSPMDDCHVRFYHRMRGEWKSDVHELWETDGEVFQTQNCFLHYNYKDVDEYVSKIDSYSTLAAYKTKQISLKNIQLSMFARAIKDFFKRYIYKLGFLDGYHGLMLSYLQAIYYLSLGVKEYENYQNK